MTYFTFCPECGFQEVETKDEMIALHECCVKNCSEHYTEGSIVYGEITGKSSNAHALTLCELDRMGFQVTLSYHGEEVSEEVEGLLSKCRSIQSNHYSAAESVTGAAYKSAEGFLTAGKVPVRVCVYIDEKGQSNE